MTLFNDTPYAVGDVPLPLPDGRNVVAIVVKATLMRKRDGTTALADAQRPIRFVDELLDADAAQSSITRPNDACAQKVGADVMAIGAAISPRAVRAMDVAISVRDCSLTLRVHGERLFERGATGLSIGRAAPFERMPICYERCFGGSSADHTRIDLRNPVGRGVAARADDLVGHPAPQIEEPAHPIHPTDAVEPVCFAPIPSHWMPRAGWFGTCDEAWRQGRMPLPPHDYDVRAENAAHPKLQLAEPLRGGEIVGVRGMNEASENWTVTVPEISVLVAARYADGRRSEVRPVVDTLLLEPNDDVVELTMRAALPLRRGAMILREVAVRHG